jgi:histone-lysine N-methyltransferase SETMAR
VIVDNQFWAIIEAGPCKTTQEVAELNLIIKQLFDICTKLENQLDKLVPHELNKNNKIRHYEVCPVLLLCNKNDPFLNRRSGQWLDQGKAPKLFPKSKLHQKKVMVTVWWQESGIHYNFLNPSKTSTAEKYCQEIDKLHQELQRLHPTLVNQKGPILFHDNARPHVSQMTLQKLNELGHETLAHQTSL